MGEVLSTPWIYHRRASQQMHWEGENMQPHELCWRQRPRNLSDLRLANCSSKDGRNRAKCQWKRYTRKSRRQIQSTRRSQEESYHGGRQVRAKTSSVARGNFRQLVTDLKLLARCLDITETEKLIRNAIACKSLHERVRQRCLKKSKHLEATKDGMEVI